MLVQLIIVFNVVLLVLPASYMYLFMFCSLFVDLCLQARKGEGFEGSGTPDPFNQNDDDQVDTGEPNAPDAKNPNDDANTESDEDAGVEDSIAQVAPNLTALLG